jgi:hypothetical protein
VTDTPPESEPAGAGVDAPVTAPGEAETEATGAARFLALFWDLAKPQYVALLIGLVVLAIVSLSGGWNSIEAGPAAVRPTPPGSPLTATPFTITVKKALWTEASVKGLIYAEEGVRSLMVSVEITNFTPEPVSTLTLGNAFRIDSEGLVRFGKPAPAAKVGPTMKRAADFRLATYAQPNLPTRLVLIWEQSTTLDPPTQVVVTVRKHTWRASALAGGMDWFDAADTATVTLPVTEYRA